MQVMRSIRKAFTFIGARLNARRPGAGAPPAAAPDDYLKSLRGPHVRVTTVRILDPESVAKGILSRHEHLEGDTPDGPRQLNVYAAASCSCGCLFDKETWPAAVCRCGKVMCTVCTGQCMCCRAACCSACRVTYKVGDAELTYCLRCRWKHYFRLWWGLYK